MLVKLKLDEFYHRIESEMCFILFIVLGKASN